MISLEISFKFLKTDKFKISKIGGKKKEIKYKQTPKKVKVTKFFFLVKRKLYIGRKVYKLTLRTFYIVGNDMPHDFMFIFMRKPLDIFAFFELLHAITRSNNFFPF